MTDLLKPTTRRRPRGGRGRLVRSLLAAALVLGLLPRIATAEMDAAKERLVRQLVANASILLEVDPLTVQAIDGASVLLELASELTPNDPELWRMQLQIATLTEDPARRSQALQQLARTDQRDERARLLRLLDVVDQHQTVDERIATFQQLLDRRVREQLGPAVASRLALELAVLHRRAGNLDDFGVWLAEAASIDPSHRAAAAMAAGYFRTFVDDPYAEAELLVNLLLADPTDAETMITLARLLLDQGAYAAADRMYTLAVRTMEMGGRPAPANLLADQAIARWGSGDAEGALAAIQSHQALVDARHRARMKRENPDLTPLELARMHDRVAATLATVRAAIHHQRGDDLADETRETALEIYESVLAELRGAVESGRITVKPEGFATLTLEMGWVATTLGADPDRAESIIAEADGHIPLVPEARQRFDGWLALRRGDPARAIELLQPLAESDPGARLGLALALRETGNEQGAARALLAVARAKPGSAMGVWAGQTLYDMLGDRLPSRAALTPHAERLDALVETIPFIFDRLPDDPTLAVALRVRPAAGGLAFKAYEPIIVNVEIANRTSFPLAIDMYGPIRPHVALLPRISIANAPGIKDTEPIIVDIDRRLRLGPHERLVVPVDLRRTRLAQDINKYAVSGAVISLTAMLNFAVSPVGTEDPVLLPGLLGTEVQTPPFRVDGVRFTHDWVVDAVAHIMQPDSAADLTKLALLTHIAAQPMSGGPDVQRIQEMIPELSEAIIEAYTQIPPTAQAWMLLTMSDRRQGANDPIEPILQMARKSEDRLVRAAYLMRWLRNDPEAPRDPMLDAALRSGDPTLERIAEFMSYFIERSRRR